MKVYLIKASAGSDYSQYKAETGGPPQNIFSTAVATPEGVDIEKFVLFPVLIFNLLTIFG